MEFLQEITLELNSNTAYTTIGAKQGDSGSRVIKVHITQNGEPWTIPSSVSASYRVRKPDGYAVWNSATVPYPNPENVLYITLSEQALATAGRAYADIVFSEGSGDNLSILSTVSFIIIIMASPDITKNVISSNEFSQILELTADADAVLDEAEAWAAGTKKSVPIAADSLTYEKDGDFTCNINESTFRSIVGAAPGYTRQFTFICDGPPEGETNVAWSLHYPNGDTLYNVDLSSYGIQISGTQLQNNYIRITMTDSDVQYQNNAKYYTDQIKNLTVTASSVAPGEPATVVKDSSGEYLNIIFGIPSGLKGDTGVTSVSATATNAGLAWNSPPWASAALVNSELSLSFGIPPGKDGSGSVTSVDGIDGTGGNVALGAVRYAATQSLSEAQQSQARANIGVARTVDSITPASDNIQLSAVRYVEQALSTSQQAQARTNINAQVVDDYIVSPSSKASNQYLKYDGSSWIAASVAAVPSDGNAGQVLKKGLQETYSWGDVHEVPSGGSASMVLMKSSNTSYDYAWSSNILTTSATYADIGLQSNQVRQIFFGSDPPTSSSLPEGAIYLKFNDA